MVKRSGSIIAIFLAVMLSVPFTTGCSCSESKQEKETTTTGNETKEESTTTEETITLVSNIMNTYSTDFEREKALYESICLNCRYDYDSLETGLTHEGQSAYGVLVEHKAVCGGYSTTFGIALTMMGIENELVIGMVSAGPHGWNKVCLEGEWYEVDVTWGDGTGDEYDYTYFNLTTDEMSLDHERRGIECNGTKYGQTYIKKLLREEYLADKVVIDTQEEALKYINEALNSGKTSIEMVFSNADVKNAVRELVKPDYWEEGERYKIYNIDKDSENYYFDFETLWDYGNEGIWYNKYTLEGIFRIDIFVTYLNDFREKENYFETLEEFYAYVRAEREKGMHEIKAYLAFTEDEINMMNMDTSQFGEGYYGAAYRTACDSDNMVEYTVYFMQ